MQVPAQPSDPKITVFLNRHKISRRVYEKCVKIEGFLSKGIGPRAHVIETLKFSKHPEAKKLLDFCFRISYVKRLEFPIEVLCLCAGVDPQVVLGVLMVAAQNISRLESALITAKEHPNMVQATATWGQMFADNSKDREMFHKAAGWLPMPKGSRVNINFGGPPEEDDDEDDDGETSIDAVFGSDPMEIEGWGESRRKMLESGRVDVLPPSR